MHNAEWRCKDCDRWDSTQETNFRGDRLTIMLQAFQHSILTNHAVNITILRKEED